MAVAPWDSVLRAAWSNPSCRSVFSTWMAYLPVRRLVPVLDKCFSSKKRLCFRRQLLARGPGGMKYQRQIDQ